MTRGTWSLSSLLVRVGFVCLFVSLKPPWRFIRMRVPCRGGFAVPVFGNIPNLPIYLTYVGNQRAQVSRVAISPAYAGDLTSEYGGYDTCLPGTHFDDEVRKVREKWSMSMGMIRIVQKT
ncbi:hypothetical protein F4778DRAFT_714744 [Xylariomycetidae sp. FL2044]|nr:hypothetical protein F4778DRAFT_714744 [Xylariomycetidae sp. FL2044]